MFCPNCGAKGNDDAKYCAECGADLKRARKIDAQATADVAGLEVVPDLDALVRGSTYVTYAVLGSFIALLLMYTVKLGAPAWPFKLVWLGCYIHVIFDCYAMAKGLGSSAWLRFVTVVLAIIPLLNFIVAIALSVAATRRLRKAGYSFGLFGVKGYRYRT